MAVPYGYTLSLWAASALAGLHFGSPGLADIASFVIGAVAGFLLLAGWSHHQLGPRVPQPVSSQVTRNALPLVSLAVSPVGWLVPWSAMGYAVSGFVATLGYALTLSFFIRVIEYRAAGSN